MFPVVIQPEECAAPMQPVGLLRMNWSLKLCRGKINIGGTVFPVADTTAHIVINDPLSPDVTEPICFRP